MNCEELKKKIAQIIADYFCPQGNEHKKLWGDDRLCYSKMNFAECEWVTECTDALIAAGIGDVKRHRVFVSKDGKEVKQFYSGEEVENILKEREEYKHRAEVAERAVYNLAYGEWQREGARRAICEKYAPSTARDYLDRAEKELAEERKDEQN